MASANTNRTRSEAQAADARKQRLIIIGVIVAVLALVTLVAVLTANESGSAVRVPDIAGSPTVEGDPLPQPPEDPTADPHIGDAAPVATSTDFDGNTVTIGDGGTPTMVMFLASWCPACQQELPMVVDWIDSGGLPEGVDVTAVVTSLDHTRGNWPPDAWLEREGWSGPTLVDDENSTIASSYGLTGTPYWVAIDGDGRIVTRLSGMLDEAALTAMANTLAAG